MIGRLTLGARARAVGGRRSPWAVAAQLPVRRAALGALAGLVAVGPAAAVLGGVAGAVSPRVQRMRAARGRARLMDEQVPDVLRSIAAAVRAGRSLPQALEAARDEAREPIRAALDTALARIAVGTPVDDAVGVFARAAGSPLAAVAAETIRVGRRSGGNFPLILDTAVASATERLRIARDRHAATAQARMSALVVGLMPVAFYGLVGSSARAGLARMLEDPVGWLVLAAGVALELAGVVWMRALTRL